MVTIGRREFIFVSVACLLFPWGPAGCREKPARSTDPGVVLNDLRSDNVIKKLRSGEMEYVYKSMQGHIWPNAKEALATIQRGLISLELMNPLPEDEYGVYGPKTEKAVKYLQNWAGIDRAQGWDGRKFNALTLQALEKALQEKIAGRWNPPKNL